MTPSRDPWGDIALSATKDWTTLIPLVFAVVVLALVVLVILAAVAVALRYVLRGKTLKAGPLALGEGAESDGPPAVESRLEALERGQATLERGQEATRDLGRLTLERLDTLSVVSRTILEVVRDNYCNGNVGRALTKLDQSDQETKEFPFDAAAGGKESAS